MYLYCTNTAFPLFWRRATCLSQHGHFCQGVSDVADVVGKVGWWLDVDGWRWWHWWLWWLGWRLWWLVAEVDSWHCHCTGNKPPCRRQIPRIQIKVLSPPDVFAAGKVLWSCCGRAQQAIGQVPARLCFVGNPHGQRHGGRASLCCTSPLSNYS